MLLLNKIISLSSTHYSYHEIILKDIICIKIDPSTMITRVKIFLYHIVTHTTYMYDL